MSKVGKGESLSLSLLSSNSRNLVIIPGAYCIPVEAYPELNGKYKRATKVEITEQNAQRAFTLKSPSQEYANRYKRGLILHN